MMAIESRCRRNAVALRSPDFFSIMAPMVRMKSSPLMPQFPIVSHANGMKTLSFFSSVYLFSLSLSAKAAADPTDLDVCAMYDGANVSRQVKSQTRGFPLFHGVRDNPSGRLLSRRSRPGGSRILGVPAVERARWIMKRHSECLARFPLLL